MRFLRCPRNPLRGSAWSRCKNPWCFAISAVLAQPSAGIGVVEVQKLEVFCGFCCSNWSSGVVSWFPEPAGRGFDSSLVRRRASQDATCILKQLAQSKLHRATCADQLAPTSLRRAPCLEQLAQSNLRRATCTEQLAGSAICTEQLAGSHLQGPTCRSNLRGATCADQLAQCNLRRATCADQLAPTSLRRAPCLVLSRACFTNASWREKERILQRWADLACDDMLSGQPWSSCFLFRMCSRRVPAMGVCGPHVSARRVAAQAVASVGM